METENWVVPHGRKEHTVHRHAAGQVSLAGAGSGKDGRRLLYLQYCFPSASTMCDHGCRAGCLTMPTFWYTLSV